MPPFMFSRICLAVEMTSEGKSFPASGASMSWG